MSRILAAIIRWLPTMQSVKDRDDAYLAESVDIYDLERRMREIEMGGRNLGSNSLLGFGLR